MDTVKLKAFYEDKVAHILKQAKAQGATEAEVSLSAGEGFSVNVRQQDLETLENQADQGMGITVYFGKKKGSADTGDLSDESLQAALHAACHIAQFTVDDPCSGLPDPEHFAKNWPDLDLAHPYPYEISDAIALAQTCEKAGLDYDPRIVNSEGAAFSTYEGLTVYGNTHGFLASSAGTRHSLSLSLIAAKNKQKERDYSFSVSRDFHDLWRPESIAIDAAEAVLKRLNPRSVKTQKAPVLFASHLAGSLIHHYLKAVSGGNLYRKTTFLTDSLGTQVFPDFLTFYENPFIPKGLGSAPFDGEGVAIAPQNLVERGCIKTYLLNSYTARQLGRETTGFAGGIRNLLVQSTKTGSFDDLLQEMGTGLLVTELIGQGVNLITGDYSRGASGLWIENGKIQHAVSEVTIAGHLGDIFKTILAIGADVETRNKIQVGSILVSEMMIGGTNTP